MPSDLSGLADKLFGLFLDSDMHENHADCGFLPLCLQSMHGVKIGKSMVLQIDEILNVGTAAENRGNSAGPRMLKLSLTDGITQV